MLLLSRILVVVVSATTLVAGAAPLPPQTFYFNNTVLSNTALGTATVTGSVDFTTDPNPAGGAHQYTVVANHFSVSAAGRTYTFVSNTPATYSNPFVRDNAVYYYFFDDTNSPLTTAYTFGLALEIFRPPFNLDGATLCPVGGDCSIFGHQVNTYFSPGYFLSALGYSDISGNLSATPPVSAPTPEPSTFALLGTGLSGAVILYRRRFLGEASSANVA